MIMKRLKAARKEHGYTLKELGKMVGVSEATMSNYETGRREPDFAMITKLSEILEVSVDYLLGISDDPATQKAKDADEETEAKAWEIRERLRRDPSYRLLFDAADNAAPEHLRAAAAMLKALEPKEDD